MNDRLHIDLIIIQSLFSNLRACLETGVLMECPVTDEIRLLTPEIDERIQNAIHSACQPES